MRVALALAIALGLGGTSALAVGLAPLRNEGPTPSRDKAFYVNVINPYSRAMEFRLDLYERDLSTPAAGASLPMRTLVVPPRSSRRIVFNFTIGGGSDERTVRLCAHSTEDLGTVMPRVCGTYVGYLYGSERHRRSLLP
ncbi:hypothetical protein [Roseobacter sp. HKCCA0434]|uniref:hypothetical protein n=1 Tax=Roseobacter sp. HKCCA0434 TaxID=3079297 RepID=UPI002905BAC7|nr:hypothetical protein [Roseobacter sp. HKCCA0434]